ncbi:MAG: flagellar biosynthetic protein FlhB [Deltaproteobacteria bacterium]|nr:MAG: flagellar biosynthetic protein FlhB [Deltaproteobacteria bacterium]
MSDKVKKAVALRYDKEADSAPRVVAKGRGNVAEKILQIAREYNIPLKEDPILVDALSTLDLYQEIPPELYRAVAEVLAFVYRLTQRELK